MSDSEEDEQEAEEEAADGGSSEAGSSDEEEASSSSEEELEEARVLPNRSTRGKRMGELVEEDDADQEFWGQDFFQEEARDTDWESSASESEDEPDSDFDQPVRSRYDFPAAGLAHDHAPMAAQMAADMMIG